MNESLVKLFQEKKILLANPIVSLLLPALVVVASFITVVDGSNTYTLLGCLITIAVCSSLYIYIKVSYEIARTLLNVEKSDLQIYEEIQGSSR